MTAQGQGQFIGGDTTPIISHTNQRFAAVRHINADAARAGIYRVFKQFLDRRGRSFNHFTRSNAIDGRLIQLANDRPYVGGMGVHATTPSMLVSDSTTSDVVGSPRFRHLPTRQLAGFLMAFANLERDVGDKAEFDTNSSRFPFGKTALCTELRLPLSDTARFALRQQG